MKKFLVADDSMLMRGLMKKVLAECGYTVIGEAENGEIAVGKYKELQPDIVTMDITMKKMTGIEALKEILAYDSKAKVVMVSAMGQKPYVQAAISAGAKGFLVKPFNTEAVLACVRKL